MAYGSLLVPCLEKTQCFISSAILFIEKHQINREVRPQTSVNHTQHNWVTMDAVDTTG